MGEVTKLRLAVILLALQVILLADSLLLVVLATVIIGLNLFQLLAELYIRRLQRRIDSLQRRHG